MAIDPSAPQTPLSEVSAEIARDFVALNEYLRETGEHGPALQRLVDLAVSTLPGCDWAALTAWPAGREPRSLACSSPVALAVDLAQYRIGQGPCLTAAAEAETVYLRDLTRDERYPHFAAEVVTTTPVRCVVAMQIADQSVRTALNIYAGEPDAFDGDGLAIAALFVAHARVLLLHAESRNQSGQLTTALASSRQIGTAIGILMTLHRVTEDNAFTMLRTSSQRLHRKLRDIAVDVRETGALPDER